MASDAALDQRIESLSSRIQQLELATGAGGPAPGPQGEKHPLLAALKPSAAGLEAEQLQAERDKALAQVELLKNENAKLEYRVLHLLRALNMLEAQQKQ